MTMGDDQTRRLVLLLEKLVERDASPPTPGVVEISFSAPQFGGQEHLDAQTLTFLGWIRHRSLGRNVSNSWSTQGIYDFDITEDGMAALLNWRDEHDPDGEFDEWDRPLLMVIHGSQDGRIPQIVEDIRLWCYDQGLEAVKAADLPNAGRFVKEKVDDAIDDADYYIVVLTADEELTSGIRRPRPNAMIEMGRVLERDPERVCVLKEDGVEMPSDYAGLVTESLREWKSVLHRELKAVDLL